MSKTKKVRKGAGMVLLFLAGILLLALIWLTIREYRPEAEETLAVPSGSETPAPGSRLEILTFNTGYAGLDKTQDFFMDGGSQVQPDSRQEVEENLQGIAGILKEHPADVYFLQEVDLDSKRSYRIDQQAYYQENLDLPGVFACNFKCDFIPYPLPPIGKVESGILTMTDLAVSSASRISLPESFFWPVKTCNLKRCMLETRIPLTGTDRELVLINFHLEAYDSGEGKIRQSQILAEKLQKEYEAGNYVIAGGDFNQTFEGIDKYPLKDTDNWAPGVIGEDSLPEHFSFAVDDSYPTCRLLNEPYSGSFDTAQVYVLDGFLVSDNIKVNQVSVINTDFAYTDHQPVRLEVRLLP